MARPFTWRHCSIVFKWRLSYPFNRISTRIWPGRTLASNRRRSYSTFSEVYNKVDNFFLVVFRFFVFFFFDLSLGRETGFTKKKTSFFGYSSCVFLVLVLAWERKRRKIEKTDCLFVLYGSGNHHFLINGFHIYINNNKRNIGFSVLWYIKNNNLYINCVWNSKKV